MQDSFVATCHDCGKKYRVPAEDRIYDCKECGGEVYVDEAPEPEPEPEFHGSRPLRRERRPNKRNKFQIGVYATAVLVVVGGILWLSMGGAQASGRGSETDLSKVIEKFEEEWNAGDSEGVAAFLHPQQQQFGEQIRVAAERRGWTDGFVEITYSATPTAEELAAMPEIKNSSGQAVKTGISLHRTKDGPLVTMWQFNPPNETWYVYALEIPAPDLGARLDGFDEAWNAGDEAALRQYLQQDKPDKLIEAFAKVAAVRSWSDPYPDLSARETDPPADELAKPGLTFRYKTAARAIYMTEHGEMSFIWKLQRDSDDWFVSSVKGPPR